MAQNLNKFKFTFNDLGTNFDKVSTTNLSYPITLRKTTMLNTSRRYDGRRNKFRFSLIKNLRLKKKREYLTRTFSKRNTDIALNLQNVLRSIKNFKKMYKKMEKKLKRKPI